MTDSRRKRPRSIRLLEASLLIQGISGVVGGVGLVLDPTGESLQIPIAWLEGSPFSSYLIPGVILLVLLGVYPLVTLYGVRVRTHWAWMASVSVGGGLLIWIVVEIMIVGYQPRPPLQLIYGLLALLILTGSLVRPSREHLRRRRAPDAA